MRHHMTLTAVTLYIKIPTILSMDNKMCWQITTDVHMTKQTAYAYFDVPQLNILMF